MERLLASLRGLFFPGAERSFEQDLCQGMSLLAGLLALLVVLFHGRARLAMLGLILVNGLALYGLEWRMPSLVTHFPSADARMFDLAVGFVVCVMVSALTVWMVVAAYHRERAALQQATEERRRLEAMLTRNQKLDSLGNLAGGVAHDMNNVLAAVLGLAELHQERLPEGDPTRRALETIARASLRGRSLVQGLLDFARQGLPEARLLDLAGVAEEQVALLERTALKNLQVVRDYAPDLAPVKGDPAALGHALMNVLVNASHAMPGGGTLTLRARNRDGGGTELQVQDTGTGMSPDILTRAMDPFFTTKPQGEGTGLGLAIVYATIKGHRGEILLESEPGQGTTVTLRFPTALRQEPGEGAPRGLQTLPEGRRILVVDDDPLVHASLGGMLERLGLEVHRATSGEEALRLLEAGDLPHALILDLNMPGMGGAACLAELRRRWPDLPVLISTGRLDEAARTLLAAHPGVGSLPKPYTRAELQEQLLALWHRGSRPRDP